MKADKDKMFPVPLKTLKPEDGAPFPVYLFLKLNHRFIPIRLPGDPIGLKKFEQFLEKQHLELWVPNNFQDVYKSYLDFLQRTGHPIANASEVAKAIETEQKKEPASASSSASPAKPVEATKSEEAALVRDVLEDEELTSEEKANVLSAVSQDLLRALNQITTRGEPVRSEGLKRCKEIADEILNVAAQSSNIYDEILALRSSQEDIEHSVIVGTLAVMFGMSIGLTDEQLLADLTVGAIFHDIGIVKVKPEIMAKNDAKWSATERKEYEGHVESGVNLLKESGTEFHPRVFRMIAEHHENYDGSGFPKGAKGAQIDETSALLHMANLFDRLCTGKQTGTDLAPSEAFDYIYDVAENPNAVQEIQPELVQRIFQFMLTEKESADAMQEQAQERVENALKTNL